MTTRDIATDWNNGELPYGENNMPHILTVPGDFLTTQISHLESPNEKYLKTQIAKVDSSLIQKFEIIPNRTVMDKVMIALGGRVKDSQWIYSKSIDDNILKKLEKIGTSFNNKETFNTNYLTYPCKGLLKVDNIYIQDEYYVVEYEGGIVVHSQMDNLENIKIGKPPIEIESSMVGNSVIDSTGSSILIKDENNIKATIVGDDIVVLDKDDGQVLVLNDNLFEQLQIDKDGKQSDVGNSMSHPYGQIKKMRIDKNSNFLVIISDYNGERKLHILNRKDFSKIKTFDSITDILHIDNKNSLICLDADKKAVSIDTNMNQFPRGYIENSSVSKRVIEKIQDTTVQQAIKALESNPLTLNPDLDIGSSSGDMEHGKIIELLWKSKVGESTLIEMFNKANTIEDINVVQELFLQVQKNSTTMTVPGITDEIETMINKKRFIILLENVKGDTSTLRAKLDIIVGESDSERLFTGLIHLEIQLKAIEKQRSQILDVDTDLDTEISEIAGEISSAILDIRSKKSTQTLSSLEGYFTKIETYLSRINYMPQITSVYNTNIYKEAVRIIDFFDEDEKKAQTKHLDDMIKSHMSRLEMEAKSGDNKRLQQIVQHIDEVNIGISRIQRIIASIDDSTTLSSVNLYDPFVAKLRDSITELPKAEGDVLKISLENIFKERNQEIRMSQLYSDGVSVSLDEYGIDTGLYYADVGQKNIGFKLKGSRTVESNIRLALHYDDGTIFDLDSYLDNPGKYAEGMLFDNIDAEMSQLDFLSLQKNVSKWNAHGKEKLSDLQNSLTSIDNKSDQSKVIKKIHKHKAQFSKARTLEKFATTLANKLDLNPRAHLNLPNPRFIVLDEEQEIFKKMSAGFSIQKQEQKGIEILEGDPGLGKTMICQEFAAITNREVVRIQCSEMDPSDLFFSPQLKAGETSLQAAEWIKVMQKPGVVLLFDEIDKLNPQCFDKLHSLFDAGRSIFDPRIGTIKAHPDCLFAGTRNSYKVLSSPIVSRSNIIQINAPSEENEAYKLAKYTGIDYFKNINFSEFKNLYTEKPSDAIKSAGDEKLTETLANIRGLVKLFQILRKKQKSDDFQEKFEFEVSYREAEQIFLRYVQLGNVSFSELTQDILVPKARAVVQYTDEKSRQEEIVKKVIRKCFN